MISREEHAPLVVGDLVRLVVRGGQALALLTVSSLRREGAGLEVGWFVLLGVLGAVFDAPGMTARDVLSARVSRTTGTTMDRLAGIRRHSGAPSTSAAADTIARFGRLPDPRQHPEPPL